MATLAQDPSAPFMGDERFFLRCAIVMTVVVVAGFLLQLVMGRSSFASPVRVHVHAVLFMGWVAIYLMQNILMAKGCTELHKRLGWLAAIWLVPMVVSGFVVTVAMVRNGTVPFFFQPVQFLIFDPVAVLTFAGLTLAAILLRSRTEWHRRLHFCAMTILLAPAFGRLFPLPLLQPWAWEVAFAVTLLFPIFGAWSDARRNGQPHPAWHWGLAAIVGSFVLTQAVSYSPIGIAIYKNVTAGHRGATVEPLRFAPPPTGPQITGRP